MCNNHGDLTGNAGKKYICFGCDMVPGLSSCNTHIGFKVIDGIFYNSAYLIKGIPFLGISLDTGEHAEIHVISSIGGASSGSVAARISTVKYPFAFYHADFRTTPFDAVGSPLFPGNTTIVHGEGRGVGTGGVSIDVVADFFERALISGIIGNKDFRKMKFIF